MITKTVSLIFLLLWATYCSVHSQTVNQSASTGRKDLEKAVKEAFAAYEKTNNLDSLFKLPQTVEIIKYLEPYLASKKPVIREVIVEIVGQIKSDEAIPLLVRGIADTEKRNAEVAATILFENYSRETLEKNRDLGDALSKIGVGGIDSVAFYPLLSYFPTAANQKTIAEGCRQLTADKNRSDLDETQKLLPACVVQLGGGTEKERRWIENFRTEPGRSFMSLLDNLDLIEDPNALEILFQRTIVDDQPIDPVFIEFGVSTPNPRYEPRLLDYVINRYAKRLQIDVGFKLREEKRYTKLQVAAARRKILAELALLKK